MKLLSTNQSNTKVKKSIKYMNAWYERNIFVPDYASLSLMPDYKICGGAKSGGCMVLCLKGSIGEVYNIASEFELSNLEMAKLINSIIRPKNRFIHCTL